MSQGIAVVIKCGKSIPGTVYIQLKNKAVYRYSTVLTPAQMIKLKDQIEHAGRIVQLKHWTKVR